ncbi:hypothetical protein DEO72_LG8g1323 [Vigna unguiculata]|uniref:Uncharacterized protein n=1 Tax=Vigna unguiculata TaxID=3917 RepID=A0A4D6MT82_VIGUN|nr:hypothetical protein DEO72_LG8g1323 [Vigna unguiculata]
MIQIRKIGRVVVRRLKFEDPRPEQIQDIDYFREDLHRRLLSADFKKQVDGLQKLQKALPSIAKEVIEVLDILLRWFLFVLQIKHNMSIEGAGTYS